MENITSDELVKASGLTLANFHQLVHRRLIQAERAPGRRKHDVEDVVEAALMAKLNQVGVPASRAAMFWPVVRNLLHHDQALLLLAPRADGSDTDFRIVLPGGNAEVEHPNAPAVMAVVNVAALKRDVGAKLAELRGPAKH